MSADATSNLVLPIHTAVRTDTGAESPVLGSAGAGAAVDALACNVAMRWLWDYVDARLPGASRLALEAHLATCAACPAHVAFARVVRRVLAEAPVRADSRATDDVGQTTLRMRVQRALANEHVEVTPHAGGVRE